MTGTPGDAAQEQASDVPVPAGTHDPTAASAPTGAPGVSVPGVSVPAVSESAVRELALRFLDRRARTRTELLAHLLKRGVPGDMAGRLVGRFEEIGLLDDQRLAEGWVASRQATRSARQLRAELARRGVDRDVASAAAGVVGAEVEEAAMLRLVDRRAAAMGNLPAGVKQRRLMAQLARRGYSADAARRCVEQVLGGSDDGAADGGGAAMPLGPDFLDHP